MDVLLGVLTDELVRLVPEDRATRIVDVEVRPRLVDDGEFVLGVLEQNRGQIADFDGHLTTVVIVHVG